MCGARACSHDAFLAACKDDKSGAEAYMSGVLSSEAEYKSARKSPFSALYKSSHMSAQNMWTKGSS